MFFVLGNSVEHQFASISGLPDGFKPKSQFGYILGLGMDNVDMFYVLFYGGTFYGHLVYFIAIWYILWSFGIFDPFLVYCANKNLATLVHIAKHFFVCSLKNKTFYRVSVWKKFHLTEIFFSSELKVNSCLKKIASSAFRLASNFKKGCKMV
jgi:hypothetical protein